MSCSSVILGDERQSKYDTGTFPAADHAQQCATSDVRRRTRLGADVGRHDLAGDLMTPSAEAFWQRYLCRLPAEHPHRHARPDAFAFGDSPSLADELAALVEIGRKQATTSLPVEFTSEGLPLPAAGDVSIVLRADGSPVAIIELTEVRHVPFQAVDATFAAAEGEGDLTLAGWQTAHRKYFQRVSAKLGCAFDEDTPVICQRFRLVWRG